MNRNETPRLPVSPGHSLIPAGEIFITANWQIILKRLRMQTVFSSFSIADDKLLWAVLAILLVLVFVVGQKASASDVKLKLGYKRPMLAFELNAGKAPEIFECWDEATKTTLRTALLWDYLFIFIYPAAIATSCFIAGRFLESQNFLPLKYGLIIMCLQLVAAMLDAAENFALLKVLRGPIESPWPQTARWCATFKFGLIIVGIAYVTLGIGVWLYGLLRTLTHR